MSGYMKQIDIIEPFIRQRKLHLSKFNFLCFNFINNAPLTNNARVYNNTRMNEKFSPQNACPLWHDRK